MTKKNICFFNGNVPWGGGEKWNFEFARQTRDAGHNVFAVCNTPSELGDKLEKEPGIAVKRIALGNLSFLNPIKLIALANFFKKKSIDTLIMALPSDLKAGGLAAKMAGVPQRIFRRGIAVPTRNTALNRYLYGNVMTELICNSKETRRQVLSGNPNMIAPERTHIIYNGIDVAEFDALPSRPLVQRKRNEIIIGNAARLTEQKGQHVLIEATRILKDRGHEVRTLIAGTGKLEQTLKEQAVALHVENDVEFLGFVSDIKGFNASLDIFAMPSYWEGFGYAQVEAMACGLPVVAFDVNSIPEVVVHDETGFLVPVSNVEVFADSLEKLILSNDLRKRLGSSGRSRVEELFEINHIFSQFHNLITDNN